MEKTLINTEGATPFAVSRWSAKILPLVGSRTRMRNERAEDLAIKGTAVALSGLPPTGYSLTGNWPSPIAR